MLSLAWPRVPAGGASRRALQAPRQVSALRGVRSQNLSPVSGAQSWVRAPVKGPKECTGRRGLGAIPQPEGEPIDDELPRTLGSLTRLRAPTAACPYWPADEVHCADGPAVRATTLKAVSGVAVRSITRPFSGPGEHITGDDTLCVCQLGSEVMHDDPPSGPFDGTDSSRRAGSEGGAGGNPGRFAATRISYDY